MQILSCTRLHGWIGCGSGQTNSVPSFCNSPSHHVDVKAVQFVLYPGDHEFVTYQLFLHGCLPLGVGEPAGARAMCA